MEGKERGRGRLIAMGLREEICVSSHLLSLSFTEIMRSLEVKEKEKQGKGPQHDMPLAIKLYRSYAIPRL